MESPTGCSPYSHCLGLRKQFLLLFATALRASPQGRGRYTGRLFPCAYTSSVRSHASTSFWARAARVPATSNPFSIRACGHSLLRSCRLCPKRPPPCVQKGIRVLLPSVYF